MTIGGHPWTAYLTHGTCTHSLGGYLNVQYTCWKHYICGHICNTWKYFVFLGVRCWCGLLGRILMYTPFHKTYTGGPYQIPNLLVLCPWGSASSLSVGSYRLVSHQDPLRWVFRTRVHLPSWCLKRFFRRLSFQDRSLPHILTLDMHHAFYIRYFAFETWLGLPGAW